MPELSIDVRKSLKLPDSKISRVMVLWRDGNVLGCHTWYLADVVLKIDVKLHSDYASNAGSQWGVPSDWCAKIYDTDVAPLIPHVVAYLGDHFTRMYGTVTHVIMSDNVGQSQGHKPETYQHGILLAKHVVENLITEHEWACIATPIASNHNYHNGSGHLVQTFVLTGPVAVRRGVLTTDGGFSVGYPASAPLSTLISLWKNRRNEVNIPHFLKGGKHVFSKFFDFPDKLKV